MCNHSCVSSTEKSEKSVENIDVNGSTAVKTDQFQDGETVGKCFDDVKTSRDINNKTVECKINSSIEDKLINTADYNKDLSKQSNILCHSHCINAFKKIISKRLSTCHIIYKDSSKITVKIRRYMI